MFTCVRCKVEKSETEFYAQPSAARGHDSSCKECRKARVSKNREDNLEYYKDYDRNRPNAVERSQKQSLRTWQKAKEDPEFRESLYKVKSDWAERNKEKRKAQGAISNGLRDGYIVRPDYCDHCGTSEKKIQGHHWSYLPEHWLDVIWLCTSCHGKEHKRLNEMGRDPDKQIELEKQNDRPEQRSTVHPS